MKSLSRVQLFATPWTVAFHAPPSIGFSRQEYWSALPSPSPEDLPNPGIKPMFPALQADALPSEPPGKPDQKSPKKTNKKNRMFTVEKSFPGGAVVKNLPADVGNARDVGLIPGSERSPGEGNGNPLQYSCLENSMNRGSWWTTVHEVAKSQTGLSTYALNCRAALCTME